MQENLLKDPALVKTVEYMKAHWPSRVRPEWRVPLEAYPTILKQVIDDFTKNPTHEETPAKTATKTRQFIRIAGLSGSGKTSQILPAVKAYCKKRELNPVLVSARYFVKYHPYAKEIEDFYGAENLRKNTDEFSTIMMFMTLNLLTKSGIDVILDVTLLDPAVEQILLHMLTKNQYEAMLLMIATSPTVTEHFLGGRGWRHSKETEQEFIRATKKALDFYAENSGNTRIILWSVYDKDPIYDGPVKNSLDTFADYSVREDLPKNDDDARREAKISYLELI